MSVLIIAEHTHDEIKPSTLNTIAAASQISADIDVLVIGHNCSGASAAAAKIAGVKKVLNCDSEHYTHAIAEKLTPVIMGIAKNYTHILAPATTSGKNLMPRVSALLDVQQISDIISVENDNTFKRPVYAGNVIATVESSDAIKVITVRSTAFDAVASEGGSASVEDLAPSDDVTSTHFVKQELTVSDRPELTAASIVISGGRGVGSAENFQIIEALADKLGAAVGASRAAVDAGYVPNDYQVGQTGKIVAPDLYMAVGISGAIQHLAGMKESKVIVAINKDEEAPIFAVADYGLVADLFDVIPELTEKLG
jgi:electron transfer flavoprotein alpha subunit